MKLVIPYRNDNQGGIELRYAIRSMVKHFKDYSGVLLIGDRPDWYTGEHIPAKDIQGRKEWSIVSKVLLCPYEDFLYSNDDFFALQDFDSSLPAMYSGPLSEHKVFSQYVERKANVMKIYPDGMFYDIHTPMVINRDKFKEANNVDWYKREYLCKSLYGNFIGGGVTGEDYKVRRRVECNVDTSQQFFSSSNYLANEIPFEKLYPIKSEVED